VKLELQPFSLIADFWRRDRGVQLVASFVSLFSFAEYPQILSLCLKGGGAKLAELAA